MVTTQVSGWINATPQPCLIITRADMSPGFCNAGAILNFSSILRKGVQAGSTDVATVQALKFVIHFVGDIM